MRITGTSHAGVSEFYANLMLAGIEATPAHKIINIDEADAQSKKHTRRGIGPAWNVLKRLSVPRAASTTHVSFVVAGRADGLPYGKPIFVVAAASVTVNSVEDTDDYMVINTASGGMEGYAWAECCKYWASIAEGGEIFIFDGHSSHEDYEAIDILIKAGVHAVSLSPNCTHVMQVGALRKHTRGQVLQ